MMVSVAVDCVPVPRMREAGRSARLSHPLSESFVVETVKVFEVSPDAKVSGVAVNRVIAAALLLVAETGMDTGPQLARRLRLR